MALVLLMDAWARGRGGSVVALTVDHGLRSGISGRGARQVGVWLAARGIPHVVLPWTGDKPASGIQEAARGARYGLLAEACGARGILHLATAHHADDQAETVLFRSQRGSGAAGMAGMSAMPLASGWRGWIRPLLAWPKQALVATCVAAGQHFIDDPSNRSPRFARTALRDRLAGDVEQREHLIGEGGGPRAAFASAGERWLATWLGRIAEPRPDGSVAIDLSGLEAEVRPAALSAALRTAGGGAYPPDRRLSLNWTAR